MLRIALETDFGFHKCFAALACLEEEWNILGLCEMRWKNFGKTTTEEGHKVFFSGKEGKHEHGVGFLVHKDIVNTVMGCPPSLQLARYHPSEGSPFQHHNSTSIRPNIRLR